MPSRGADRHAFVDQFDARNEEEAPGRREQISTAYMRDPSVRAAALRRAGGKCELCGADGFRMASGAVYLETHHIIPFCEGGRDSLNNVAAMCPNDHKRAHFAAEAADIRTTLLGLRAGIARNRA